MRLKSNEEHLYDDETLYMLVDGSLALGRHRILTCDVSDDHFPFGDGGVRAPRDENVSVAVPLLGRWRGNDRAARLGLCS